MQINMDRFGFGVANRFRQTYCHLPQQTFLSATYSQTCIHPNRNIQTLTHTHDSAIPYNTILCMARIYDIIICRHIQAHRHKTGNIRRRTNRAKKPSNELWTIGKCNYQFCHLAQADYSWAKGNNNTQQQQKTITNMYYTLSCMQCI